jgi:hypothetical protein
MILHVLNGDALADDFNLEGEIVICRECLIEGETNANSLEDFWKLRAEFIEKTYGENNYFDKVVREFEKLQNVSANDEVNLWFGNELFCQTNLWFCLSLLEKSNAKIYRVFPDSDNWNCRFDDLEGCFKNRKKLSAEDLQLGVALWNAYHVIYPKEFIELSETISPIFPHLNEVCDAEMFKSTRPRIILSQISATDFDEIFKQFSAKAAIYGYGDLQVKNILKTMR